MTTLIIAISITTDESVLSPRTAKGKQKAKGSGMYLKCRLRIIHIIDSVVLSILAGLTVAIISYVFSSKFGYLANLISSIEHLMILLPIAFLFVGIVLGILLPRHIISIVNSIPLLFRCFHIGFFWKTVFAAITCFLILRPFNNCTSVFLSFALLTAYSCAGLFIAYILSRFVISSKQVSYSLPKSVDTDKELDLWISDDQAIQTEKENLLPEHSRLADQLLDRLISVSDNSHILPSIALVGSYGSGKTSVCNLVEDNYKKREIKPRVLFCRFEAWRYQSPEAAVRGLIDTAIKEILSKVDETRLWSIPHKYLQAIKEIPGTLTRIFSVFAGNCYNPTEVSQLIGHTLLRTNTRLVVFVDDFDRIEGDQFASHQAVAKALNQLQNIPNIQYVICVGPMLNMVDGKTSKPSLDLLKLTRYQSRVSPVKPSEIVKILSKFRLRVLSNREETIHPWFDYQKAGTDPLAYNPEFGKLYASLGMLSKLVEFAGTPRVLKSILRESSHQWNSGLKGEIDWYDLLTLNALKAAEPGVYEWILRNPDIFLEKVSSNAIEKKQISENLQQMLTKSLKGEDPKRYDIVQETLDWLFPAFNSKLGLSSMSSGESPSWSQRVSTSSRNGQSYLERFFNGGVLDSEVRDEPTLSYIKKINDHPFDSSEFEERYLSSLSKLTGDINKLVQFAGLISKETAIQICETIIDWIAIPEHADIWPEPSEFCFDMIEYVNLILLDSGRAFRSKKSIDDSSKAFDEWITNTVTKYTETYPLLAMFFMSKMKRHTAHNKDLSNAFISTFEKIFLEKNHSLFPVLTPGRFSLGWLLNDLVPYPNYEGFKKQFTQKIIKEASLDQTHKSKGRVIISLISATSPSRSDQHPAEAYGMTVNRNNNESRYDMSQVMPALKEWRKIVLEDQVAQKALEVLDKEYELGE